MEPTVTARLMTASMESPATDAEDFNKVVELYWPRIFRFVLASVRDREAAETITQDCFWKAHRGWNRFRGDSSVSTWLTQIAINLIRDFARNRRLQFWRRAPSMDATSLRDCIPNREMSPEARALITERIDAVWQATETLSAKQRMIFHLRFVEDMDLLEIARATGLTEGTVKSHLFRAVHAVRRRLGRLQ